MSVQVQFIQTTAAKLSSLPIVEGRFTFVTDAELLYRDTATKHVCVSGGNSSSSNLGDSTTTVFNSDGSITETYTETSSYIKTVFEDNGSITETLYDSTGTTSEVKITTFNDDGSISTMVTQGA